MFNFKFSILILVLVIMLLLLIVNINSEMEESIELNINCNSKLKLDEALIYFNINDLNGLNIQDIKFYGINDNCYKCGKLLLGYDSICSGIYIPHGWTIYVYNNNNILSTIKYNFGEHGVYNMIYDNKLNTINVIVIKKPINSLEPLYILIGTLIILLIISFSSIPFYNWIFHNSNNNNNIDDIPDIAPNELKAKAMLLQTNQSYTSGHESNIKISKTGMDRTTIARIVGKPELNQDFQFPKLQNEYTKLFIDPLTKSTQFIITPEGPVQYISSELAIIPPPAVLKNIPKGYKFKNEIKYALGEELFKARFEDRPPQDVIIAVSFIAHHDELELRERNMAIMWLNTWDDCTRDFKMWKRKGMNMASM